MAMLVKISAVLLMLIPASPLAAEANEGIRELPVPLSMIRAGQIIEPGDITQRKFQTTERSLAGIALHAADITGMETRRSLQAGRPIPSSALMKPLAIRRGTKVTAFYGEEGFSISAQLMALDDGAAGDVITARNVDSGAIIRAAVQPGGQLSVLQQ